MNMISTGAFLPEMDASNKQETMAEKFARVWEKKNSKVARAGGVSLMALSLAACGSSDSTPAPTTPVVDADPEPTPDPAPTPTPVGKSLALTADTAGETLVGGDGDDTFTGDKDSLDDADILVDGSTTDSDVANLTDNGDLNTITISNIETVNVTVAATTAGTTTVDATGFSGVSELTVTRADVTVGGSTITGDKTVVVDGLDATDVAKVTTGAGTKNASITQATKTGATVDADTASGTVSVLGSGLIDAANATAVNAGGIGTAAQDAKDITVNAAKATDINVGSATDGGTAFDNTAITGVVTINGAAADDVDAAVSGGGSINVLGGSVDGVHLTAIDDSGVSVTTSFVGTSTKKGVISVDGSGTTDEATVSAAGIVSLATAASNQIETLNLSGNGAAVTYEVAGAATTYNVTGTQDVTLSGASTSFDAKTVTDGSSGTSTVSLTTVASADLSKVGADSISVAANGTNAVLTVDDGANIALAKDQGTSLAIAGKKADYTVNLSTADDTAASGATIDIAIPTLTLSTNVKVANIDATVGKLTMATATTAATTTTLNISGTKDVALGAVTAKAVNAADSSGKISGTFDATATITTGSGVDTIDLNDGDSATTAFTVGLGDGDDVLRLEDAKVATNIDGGAGKDNITIGSGTSAGAAAAYVVVGGAGDDSITIAHDIDSDAVIVGGDDTDTLTLADTDGNDFSDNVNFAFSAIETIDISALAGGEIKISAAQFANDNSFKLSGNDAAVDILHIVNAGTAGALIDASNVTFDAAGQAATLSLTGLAAKQDTITGSGKNDTINATTGGDIIDGNAGTDTFIATSLASATVEGAGTGTSLGVVVNLGAATPITNTAILGQLGNADGFTADAVTSVSAGTYAYLFGASAATNSAVTGSITNVENITGTGGKDYIVGDANANVLTGAGGADYLNGGLGADTITGGAAADTIDLGASDGAADTVVFVGTAGGGDIGDTITNFEVGAGGDIIDFTTPDSQMDTNDPTTAFDADTTIDDTTGIIIHGTTVAQGASATVAQATAALTVGSFDGAGGTADSVYIAYDDGANTYIGILDSDGNDDGFTGDTLTIIATLSGLADATTLTADNFADFT